MSGWLLPLESSVNHFPLVQLVFNSVDKTILYYLIWLVLRATYLLHRHRKTGKKIPLYKEGLLHALFIYIILLLQLTVFRNEETFWTVEYHKIDWSAIHWLPLVDTIKLFYGDSGFSAWYNSWGNVVWFMPLGYMGPYLFRKKMQFPQSDGDRLSFFQHDRVPPAHLSDGRDAYR